MMKFKWYISIFLGVTLSLVALYLAFRNVPFADLWKYLGTINYFWLFPTAVLIVATFVIRTLRWRIILQGYQTVGFWDAFHPLMTGFMMNCILPGRIGELARPTIMRQRKQIPISTGLATVATERLFDVVMLVILFAYVFGTIAGRPDLEVTVGKYQLNSSTLQSIAWTMVRLIVILLVGLMSIILPWSRKLIIRIITLFTDSIGRVHHSIKPLSERIAVILLNLIENIAAGPNLISHPGRLIACILLTVAIWGLTLVSYPVFALGCPNIELSLKGWTTVMVVVCFFIALPSVPGFWGLWEAGGVFALSLFGIPDNEAVGFILVNHVVQLVPVIIIGWFSAVITGSNVLKLLKKNKIAPKLDSTACSSAVEG